MPLPPDTSQWTVQILADFLDERQRANEELIRSRYEADQLALRAAIEANDKRLEGMNEFRAAMAEQAARSVTREEHEAHINAMRERMDAELAPIQKAVADQGKPNWALMIGLGSVVLGVLSGCWLLIGLQINVANTPQALAIESLKSGQAAEQQTQNANEQRFRTLEATSAASRAADVESSTDRGRLNQRVSTLESTFSSGQAERKAADARFQASLVEIETQFCAADALRNLMHANDMRMMSVLWGKFHNGERYPTDNAYYPQVCNRTAMSRDGTTLR